jgi:hypothetical protein
MAFNVAKCKIMHLGPKKLRFEYTVNRQILFGTDVVRDTGVMVSKSLKSSAQRTKAAWTTLIVLGQINSVFLFR